MIRLGGDVGAPATVIAADIITMEMVPQANEWVSYGLTAIGYVSALLGLGRGGFADYLKNLGVASLPLTARHIYDRVRAPVTRRAGTSRMVLKTKTPVQRQYEPEFNQAGARAI